MNKEIILFTGEHCAGCKPMKEKLNKLLPDFPHIGYKEINVDDEENEGWMILYQIRSVPALILLRNKGVVDVVVGNVNEHKIKSKLEKL